MTDKTREALLHRLELVLNEVRAAYERKEQQAANIREALEGLLARHKDGSSEEFWAEWDTARSALAAPLQQPQEGWVSEKQLRHAINYLSYDAQTGIADWAMAGAIFETVQKLSAAPSQGEGAPNA